MNKLITLLTTGTILIATNTFAAKSDISELVCSIDGTTKKQIHLNCSNKRVIIPKHVAAKEQKVVTNGFFLLRVTQKELSKIIKNKLTVLDRKKVSKK